MNTIPTKGAFGGLTSLKARLYIRSHTHHGSHPVVLQIIRHRRRSVVFTPYRLRTEEFDASRGEAVARTRSHSRQAYISEVNDYIRHRLFELGRIVDSLERTGADFSASDIADRLRGRGGLRSVSGYFRGRIEELELEGRHGSALALEHTLRAFRKFSGGSPVRLEDVDLPLMVSFRDYLHRAGLSANTVGFYLSRFRSVYNRSVSEGYVQGDKRPFEGLSTRVEKTRKLALSDEVLRRVSGADLRGPRAEARDLFMFSFYCRGMSFVDMAYLQWSDVRDGVIHYRRRKTGQLFRVRLVPAAQTILERYRTTGSTFVLPILRGPAVSGTGESSRELYTRYVRRRSRYAHLLSNLARSLNLEVPLSFNVARHTWASRARRKGISLSVISEGLGHTTEKTTRIYLEDMETKRIDDANRLVAAF